MYGNVYGNELIPPVEKRHICMELLTLTFLVGEDLQAASRTKGEMFDQLIDMMKSARSSRS